MTLQEYMSPTYFPLTTQPGLDPLQQIRLDAANYDEFAEAERNHHPLDEHQRAVGRELEAKKSARAHVLAEARAAGAA